MAAAPTYLVLDLDRTLLEEVPAEPFATHPGVQSITYLPSDEKREEYRAIEAAAPPGASRYRFHGEEAVTLFLVVRPTFVPLLAGLAPRLARGEVVLLIVSKNERARTEAVIEQVEVGGAALAALGAVYVPKRSFRNRGKDLALLRSSLAISEGARLIALDDAPEQFRNLGPRDTVFGLTPFAPEIAAAYLDGDADFEPWLEADEAAFRRLRGAIDSK